MAKKPAQTQEDDWQFGVNWTASGMAFFSETQRRMKCARYGIGNVSKFEHRKAIIQAIWPEHVYAWNEWSEKRLKSTCEHHFVTWMAGGGTGKTTDSAIAALEFWLEAPHETAVVVCSTTKDMLRTRIWGQIVHFQSLIPEMLADGTRFNTSQGGAGVLLDASCFIRWKDGDWKNGLKGVAVQDGPVEEAVNNIIGMHTTRVLWVLDEMQGVREAIVKAIPNLLKNPESRFWGMGNPDLLTSLLCRYSEPVEGWDSIAKFQEEWETHSHGYPGKGICCFFDGRKSPAVVNPEWGKKHPWMISQAQIDAHLWSKEVNGNEADPAFMTQSIGWPPSQGVEATVLDNSIITTFKCNSQPVWTDGFVRCVGVDPAFNGGDRGVVQFAKRGFVRDQDGSRWVICGDGTLIIPFNTESKRPKHYQILDFVKAECEKRGIPAHEVAIAAAGEGGGLKDILTTEWGPVVGIEEGGSPSERVVGDNGRTAKQHYDTRASELALGIRAFAMNHGIRGLNSEAADECCKRQTFYRNGKWCVEPKVGSKGRTDTSGRARKGFKERLGYSPDCFVAGTMISTPNGLKPIETMTEGDEVLTPFGKTLVSFVHRVECQNLCRVDLSDGKVLIGKPAHRVFVWGTGWVRMDSLSVAMELESVIVIPLWHILAKLFTRAEPSSFKAQVDTTKMGIKMRRRDFFTVSSGWMKTVQSLKEWWSTTKTEIGLTIESTISNSWPRALIPVTTCASGSIPQKVGLCSYAASRQHSLPPLHGTPAQKVSRGTGKMGEMYGLSKKKRTSNAISVERTSNPWPQNLFSAPIHVSKKVAGVLSRMSAIARCAGRLLRHFVTAPRKLAPVRVELLSTDKPVAVFNLTLVDENAYYANGVLVENCHDSWSILIEHCRLKGANVTEGTLGQKTDVRWEEGVKQADSLYREDAYVQSDEYPQEYVA